MSIKFLYFDLGNVLMQFDNQRMLRQMAEVAGIEEQRLTELLMPTGNSGDPQWQFEAGGFDEAAYFEFICNGTNTRPDQGKLERACADMFDPIEESHRLVEELTGAGHRLGLLSNTNSWHWKFLLSGQWPVLSDCFEIHITSFNEKSMKPAPRIYEAAVRQSGVEPHEIFFTDDRLENVAGAVAMGIDAVQFTTTDQLIEDLRQRGIQIE